MVFVRRFQNALAENNFLPHGSKILIAVSGGGDSIALLELLVLLQKKYRWELRIAHVNYGLRGEFSALDEALVRQRGKFHSIPVSVLQSKKRFKRNQEEELRDIRYAYFEKLRKQYRFNTIVTAHTQNDLAETLLLNLLRGTGIRGLAPLMSRPTIVRPLLSFSKKTLSDFLEATGTLFRSDTSNTNLAFTRNRIRHVLLPLLAKEFNPNIITSLARTAQTLKRTTREHPLIWKIRAQTWAFDRRMLLRLSVDQQKAFLSHFFRTFLGKSPSHQFVNETQKTLASQKSKRQRLSTRDLNIECFSDRVETTFRSKK
ncbi:MAG: tRNA lysidine(34) synthetase TilS [Candidatus Zixiibacteriota bacterium]